MTGYPHVTNAFLFDLDGTLTDTVYQHVLAWKEALDEEGIALSVWRIHRKIGMSGGLFTNMLLRETGLAIDQDLLDRLRHRHTQAYKRLAAGVGPLPGIFALACHSTGVLGKFYSEIFEHVDRAPGEALRSHGVSPLGVFRFSVWPQVLPRLMDATIYRWEHNVRAATTLGVVGAGGLGLEIITAFHLFEYREAAALVLVLLVLVTVLNGVSAGLRKRFLGA